MLGLPPNCGECMKKGWATTASYEADTPRGTKYFCGHHGRNRSDTTLIQTEKAA
jgi:hypothetical protein